MPFNETNDYTARQQEKTWRITDNQQSLFPVLGLLQSRQHFWQHWAGWDEKWIPVLRLPECWNPQATGPLLGQWVTVLGSHLWACSEKCFPQVPREQGRRETWMWSHWEVYFLWGVCGSNAAEKLHSKNWMFLLIGCSFIPYSLCFIATVLYFYFLCLLLMLSSV